MKVKNELCEEIMEEYEKEVKFSKKKGWLRLFRNKVFFLIVFIFKIFGIIYNNKYN